MENNFSEREESSCIFGGKGPNGKCKWSLATSVSYTPASGQKLYDDAKSGVFITISNTGGNAASVRLSVATFEFLYEGVKKCLLGATKEKEDCDAGYRDGLEDFDLTIPMAPDTFFRIQAKKDENGRNPATQLTIKRQRLDENGNFKKYPWTIMIQTATGIRATTPIGGVKMQSGTFQRGETFTANPSDGQMWELVFMPHKKLENEMSKPQPGKGKPAQRNSSPQDDFDPDLMDF